MPRTFTQNPANVLREIAESFARANGLEVDHESFDKVEAFMNESVGSGKQTSSFTGTEKTSEPHE